MRPSRTDPLRIGELARAAGLRSSAIRYYERHGLLPPARRSAAGYRWFSAETLERLRFIERAKDFGMSLAEIRQILDLWDHGSPPCERVRDLARRKTREVDRKLRELEELRQSLLRLTRSRRTAPHGRTICPLIEERR